MVPSCTPTTVSADFNICPIDGTPGNPHASANILKNRLARCPSYNVLPYIHRHQGEFLTMSYDLQAQGDNGVRDRTSIAALDNFHDRVQPESSADPADPYFPAVLVVMGADAEGNSVLGNGAIIAVRGIGGAAPGVVGKGGSVGGSPGVVGIAGAERSPSGVTRPKPPGKERLSGFVLNTASWPRRCRGVRRS